MQLTGLHRNMQVIQTWQMIGEDWKTQCQLWTEFDQSLHCWRVHLCGCLRHFGDLWKKTPLDCRSMYLLCFVDCSNAFNLISDIWLPVSRSPSRACLCGCLRRSQSRRKKQMLLCACTLCVLWLLVVSQFDYVSPRVRLTISQQCESVWLPAALYRPQKNRFNCSKKRCPGECN